jgi:hypothetical protein
MNKLPRRINLRLNPAEHDDEAMIAEWFASKKRGQGSAAIIRALVSYLTSVHVHFDPANERDAEIIQRLEKMPENKMQEWIKDRLYERLTGQDALTGEPLQAFVKIVEKEVPVIQERIKVIRVGSGEKTEEIDDTDSESDDTNRAAWDDVAGLDW